MKKILTLSRFELKKLFIKKSLMVIIAFMCLFNIINIVRHYNIYADGGLNDGMINRAKYTVLKLYGGELTEEKLNEIYRMKSQAQELAASGNYSLKYDPDKYYCGYAFGDAMIFIELADEAKRLADYSDNFSKLVSESEELLKKDFINDYYKKINQKATEIYSSRELTALTNNKGIGDFFDYKFSSVLCIILLILGTVLIFTADRDAGADVYLESSVNGKGKSAAAKLIASSLYTLALTLLFFVIDLISFMVLLRIDGLEQPLYSLSSYFSTPLTMPIWQFIILYFLFRILGFLCITAVTSAITVILKTPILSVIASFALFMAMIVCKTYCLSDSKRWINLFNPLIPITAPKYLKRYDAMNIFSEPVIFIGAAALCVLIITALAVCTVMALSSLKGASRKRGGVKNV